MKKALLFFFLVLFVFCFQSFSQSNNGFIWSQTFGGSKSENGNTIANTLDGGFIVAGVTSSNDGDVGSFPNRDSGDVWVIKFNLTGAIQWKKTYGGTGQDNVRKIIQTKDGGYVFIGSTSSINGDVSVNKGRIDAWIVKLNESGTILWQRTLGGGNDETPVGIAEVSNGSIVAGISTTSNNGDVFGNPNTSPKTWIVKLNQNGTQIVWSKIYGGSSGEWFRGFEAIGDNGFICAGSTSSSDGDFSGSSFFFQQFLIKLDSNGNKIFAKKIQGTDSYIGNTVLAARDGGFFIGGRGLDGKAVIVKTNSNADKLWEQQYNFVLDSNMAVFRMCYSKDSVNLFFTGYSLTTFSLKPFVAKVEANTGNPIWFKGYPDGKSGFSEIVDREDGFPILTGNILITPIIGPSHNNLLVAKFGSINIIKGQIFLDNNINGIKDLNEQTFNNAFIRTQKVNSVSILNQSNQGKFLFDVDTGSYTTTVQLFNPYYNVVPSSRNTSFTTYFNQDSFGFAVQPIPNKQDLQINFTPLSPARPGFKAQYVLNYKNVGTTTIPSGSVKLIKDSRATLSAALPVPSAIVADTLTWNYTNLKPLDSIAIGIEFQLAPPPALNINDTLKYTAVILPVAGDLTPADDTTRLRQRVQGSFDPNDKLENFAGKIPLKNVQDGSYINYVIRFQNTGNDTAFFVRLLDTLDTKLDWNSFQMIGSSHAFNLTIKDGNKLNWFFDNIKLPDSTTNLARSIGYVAFRIKPKSNLAVNDIIRNKASIYFDYNLPIVTNTANTIVSIETTTGVREIQNNEMKLVLGPNPSNGYSLLQISGKLTGKFELRMMDNNGRIVSQQTITRNSIAETVQVPLQLQQFSTGVYYIQLQQKEKSWWQKVVVQ